MRVSNWYKVKNEPLLGGQFSVPWMKTQQNPYAARSQHLRASGPLEITVDLEQQIWEIDETNNVYSASFTSDGGGFGALTVLVGGGALALLGAALLLRRRSHADIDEAVLTAAMEVDASEPAPEHRPRNELTSPWPAGWKNRKQPF